MAGEITGNAVAYGLSFFNPIFSVSLFNFAAAGAIALPLTALLKPVFNNLISSSYFDQLSDFSSNIINDCSTLLILGASLTAASAMLSLPLYATVVPLLIIPTIMCILTTIRNVINQLSPSTPAADKEHSEPSPAA